MRVVARGGRGAEGLWKPDFGCHRHSCCTCISLHLRGVLLEQRLGSPTIPPVSRDQAMPGTRPGPRPRTRSVRAAWFAARHGSAERALALLAASLAGCRRPFGISTACWPRVACARSIRRSGSAAGRRWCAGGAQWTHRVDVLAAEPRKVNSWPPPCGPSRDLTDRGGRIPR